MQKNDIKTLGYVLRRTNYGEADRILNLITPLGKIAVLAKGVRREKSKLAGGIEMFSLSEYTIHRGRGELGIATSAKMMKYYGEIIKDYHRMELGVFLLKRLNMAAENSESAEFFEILDQALNALNDNRDTRLVEAWFLLRLVRATGEEINLYRDGSGNRLESDKRYEWDKYESAFVEKADGGYGANEIKMLRIMATSNFEVVKRVRLDEELTLKLNVFSKTVAKM